MVYFLFVTELVNVLSVLAAKQHMQLRLPHGLKQPGKGVDFLFTEDVTSISLMFLGLRYAMTGGDGNIFFKEASFSMRFQCLLIMEDMSFRSEW